MVFDNILVTPLSLQKAGRGYLISLRASRYSPSYIASVEMCLRFLTDYGESHHWPEISGLTASHIEEYLVYIQERPRWFGKSDQSPASASSVETHYRRIKTFFNWLVERGYLATNPLNLIRHPRVEERVIPTVSNHQILSQFAILSHRLYN